MKRLTLVLALLAAFSFGTKAQDFTPYPYLQLQGGVSYDFGDASFPKLLSPAAQSNLPDKIRILTWSWTGAPACSAGGLTVPRPFTPSSDSAALSASRTGKRTISLRPENTSRCSGSRLSPSGTPVPVSAQTSA